MARALPAESVVLVRDESPSGLDLSNRNAILAHLAGLRDRSALSLVFITHDREAVAALADRTTVLEAGRLVGRR